jgi:hexosaminidase
MPATLPHAAAMARDPEPSRLLPRPREAAPRAGRLRLGGRLKLAADDAPDDAAPALALLRATLDAAGVGTAPAVECAPRDPLLTVARPTEGLPAEGYRLIVGAHGLRVEAADARGLRHAATTLGQLLGLHGPDLPALAIRDWPDFATRGFMLDVSRDRVPTMATLRRLVDRMAALKLNELQLYTEHTFAYRDHEAVWRDASPLTPDEVRTLDAYCAARGIELVPNQNSFGHMERWLRHPPYARLAETRSCLAPTPESAAFMEALYDELLPCFTSRRLNINCDETFGLGTGPSAAACAERGVARVYLDHVLRLVDGLRRRGYAVEFWGDVVEQHPELLRRLRNEDVTVLAWHYEAPIDPATIPDEALPVLEHFGVTRESLAGFATKAKRYRDAAVPFRVCPGTSSWNSLLGRWPNARANLDDAAHAGRAAGARGLLVTDWGDNGHLQPPVVSLPGLAYGAAVAWGLDANADLDVAEALAAHVVGDRALADALLALGAVYQDVGMTSGNASPLFTALVRPLGAELPFEVLHGATDRDRMDAAVAALDAARDRLDTGDPAARGLHQAAGLARHGAWRLMRRALGSGPDDATLRRDLEALIERQRTVWLETSRPGGLDDSLARLRRALDDYAP